MKKTKTASQSRIYFALLIVLAIVIIVESVLIVNNLKKAEKLLKLPSGQEFISLIEAKKGTMNITLEKNQIVKPNQNLKAEVNFDSQNESIAGADVILTFDPSAISIVNMTGNKEIFGQIIINQQQQKEGRIKITAYQPKKTVKGKQTLALLTLRLLKNQPAVLGIEFLGPDRVTDSNLVSQATQKDILANVQSLNLTP